MDYRPPSVAELGKYDVIYPLPSLGPVKSQVVLQRGLAGFRRVLIAYTLDIAGQTDEQNEALLEELRRISAFSHPYIPQVHGLEVDAQKLLLLGEIVEGATVAELAAAARARGEPLPVGCALRAIIDAAHALHYAHHFVDPLGRTRAVVHGDMADGRILLTFDGTVKVLGFGLPRSYPGRARDSMFLSPEQRRGHTADARSDVFSLGAVLHTLLTGQPFRYGELLSDPGKPPSARDLPPASARNSAVPLEMDVVLTTALASAPSERYASALEFATALEQVTQPWSYDACAEYVQRAFADRREQHRLQVENAETGSSTAVMPLSQVLRPSATVAGVPLTPGMIASMPTQPRHERPGEVESRDASDPDSATDLSRSKRISRIGTVPIAVRSSRPSGVPLEIAEIPTRAMPALAAPSPNPTPVPAPGLGLGDASSGEVPTAQARPARLSIPEMRPAKPLAAESTGAGVLQEEIPTRQTSDQPQYTRAPRSLSRRGLVAGVVGGAALVSVLGIGTFILVEKTRSRRVPTQVHQVDPEALAPAPVEKAAAAPEQDAGVPQMAEAPAQPEGAAEADETPSRRDRLKKAKSFPKKKATRRRPMRSME